MTNKFKWIKQIILYAIAVGISTMIMLFVIVCTWIGHEVKVTCQNAEREYGGDCAESLIKLLDDKNRGFRARNEAVWALGQLGDDKAMQVLEKYYTGNIPDQEPLDKTISQYELKKAISLLNGGTNISAWLWR